jgi:hypothetical protein
MTGGLKVPTCKAVMDARNVTSTNSIISFLLYSVSNQRLPSLTALLLRRTSLPSKECRKFSVSLPIPWATALAVPVRQTRGNGTTPDSGTEPFQREIFSCVETEGASRNGFKLATSPAPFWTLLASSSACWESAGPFDRLSGASGSKRRRATRRRCPRGAALPC